MAVTVISTGGTIASTDSSDGGGAAPELTAATLVGAVPGLEETVDIETHDFSNVPSPHFTIEQMYELVELIRELDDDPDVDGLVVTQGTDILEESAYFVDLCYDGSTPVAFTGAMRNPSLASPDGPANLLASVQTVRSEEAADAGVVVVFNDRVHAARDVTKTNSMNVDTFRSPEFGPLAVRDEDRVTWRRSTEGEEPTFDPDTDRLTNDVFAVTATADMPEAAVSSAADGAALCLAATGAGHIPPTIIPALESLRDRAVPIVATTRCPEGRLARDTYGFRGSEATLRELDCYYSERNLQKTRIKTIVALAADRLPDAFDSP
ncbi:asparaginase [Natrinema longum]|uniref:asparaginase n=1 Tax=Natrinema longum TaxID=370324 RepID=UPI001CCD183C|nr:asparaginase [Natrinema longum]MBZ6496778.1 asparaginase [Natrinema longum]